MNIDIEELLESAGDSTTAPEKLNKKDLFDRVIKEINYVSSTSLINFERTGEPLYSAYEIALVACNFLYKKVPSVINLTEKYSIDFLIFLKKEGELVYRHLTQSTKDFIYVFLYKNVFFSLTFYTDTNTITNMYAVHPVDIAPPILDLEKYRIANETKKPEIGIIKQSRYGLTVQNLKIETTQEFSYDNYNSDFSTFFAAFTDKLKEKKPGLFLLHGEPGTGKSSALRYLLTQVARDFIFIPPQMIDQLSTPDFADIITQSHKGSVLVIEDAEKALMKRDTEDGFSNSTLVSSILNLTDGLYADISNTAIIATYNCDRNLIDSALLRKGRMKAEYRFDKLSIHKSQALMDKLGRDVEVKEAMTLADIFNYEDQYSNAEDDRRKKSSIGFSKRPGF